MIKILIFYFLWGWVGGFDWFFDFMDCIFNNVHILTKSYLIWEPNFNSYNEWVQSMLEKDPSYEQDLLSKQEYINAKYPNYNEIEDENILNYILAELYEYEDEI